MAKKDKISIAITVSKEDNLLLKQHLLNLENLGVIKTKSEIASDLFVIGLHNEYENVKES
jgi:hypothetical protein